MLEKDDLKAIKEIVNDRAEKTETYLKDYVEFAIDKSEQKSAVKFEKIDKRFEKIETELETINQNLTDIIETNQEFLSVLGGHEKRIKKLETVVEKC